MYVSDVSGVSGVSDVYQVSQMYPESLRHLRPIAYQMYQGYQMYSDTPDTPETSDTPNTSDTPETPDTPDTNITVAMVTPDTSDTPDTLRVSLIHLIQKALPWIILSWERIFCILQQTQIIQLIANSNRCTSIGFMGASHKSHIEYETHKTGSRIELIFLSWLFSLFFFLS